MSNPPRIHDQALPTLASLSRFWQFKRKKLAVELQGYLADTQNQLDTLFSTQQQLLTQRTSLGDEIRSLQSRNYALGDQLQIETANLVIAREALDQEKSKLQKAMLALAQARQHAKTQEERHAQALTRIAELEEHLAEQKQQSLDKQQRIAKLQGELADVRQQLEEMHIIEQQLTDRCGDQTAHIKILEAQHDALTAQLQAEQTNVADLENRKAQALAQISQLEAFLEDHRNQLLSKEQNVHLLESLTEQLKASHQHLEDNYANINNQHLSLTEKFSLVSKVLAQQPPSNEALATFAELINNDYMEFASQESSLAGEAQAVLEMQAILAEMQMLNNFPSIAGKTILSIAGGFSSGKSAFVNSFIHNSSVKLATGINPVTVVPSYVVCSEETRIKGYSYNGGSLDLEPGLYTSMCHEYVQAFGFDLRRILPFISVNVPMDQELFGNLCIIDTPGYNPGTTGGAAAADRGTAASLVNQASALVWVIGLDPAGTIDQSDIEFIESTPFRGESLYIVLNKADVKSENDILQIMEQVADDLSFAGIEYAGMCAYSSIRQKDYPFNGLPFEQFLRSINRKVDVVGKVISRLDGVFNAYKHAINADIAQLKARKKEFAAFKLDALEIGGTDLFDRFDQAFPISEQAFDASGLEKLANECEQLSRRVKLAAQKALGISDSVRNRAAFEENEFLRTRIRL